MGKYLGVPLHYKHVTRRTHENILGKMDRKLSAWKTNSLSIATHHTLVQSVVSAIPSYEMQTVPLQSSTCKEIDKRCRAFFMGELISERE